MSIFGPTENMQAFHRLAAHYGHTLSGNAHKFSVSRGGREYELTFVQMKNVTMLTLSCNACPLPDATMRTESGTDRFGKRLGLNYEPQTGDPLFDQHVFVACSLGDENLKRLLEAEGVRKGVLFLLQSGFSHVEFGKKGITTSMNIGLKFQLEPKAIDEALTALEMLTGALPDFSRVNLRHSLARPMTMVGIIHGVMLPVGVVLLVLGGIRYTPVDWSPYFAGLGAGGALWFVASFVAARLLRGKTDAFRAWLLSSGLSLIGCPLLTIGGLLVANAALDASPPATHSVIVVDKTSSTSRKSRTYYLHVQSWRPTEPQLKIRVPQHVYSIASIGSKTTIITHKGYLGWEWILKP